MDEPSQTNRWQFDLKATAMTPWDRERAMFLRTQRTRSNAFAIVAAAVLALGGMLIARNTDVSGWWILLAFSCTAALVFMRPQLTAFDTESQGEELDVTPWGVRRYDQDGLHEAVSWADLTEVSLVTKNDGPRDEDLFVLLRGRNNNGVMIPHTLAVESGVLTELQLRLSDFDNVAFVNAMTSTADGEFVLWRTPAPKADPRPSVLPHAMPHLRAAS